VWEDYITDSNDDIRIKKIYLREYQWLGVFWITHLRRCGLGAALCDEMGTGKSVQTIISLIISSIELSDGRQKSDKDHPSLLVCPESLLSHWINEIDKFVVDTSILVPMRYRSGKFKKNLAHLDSNVLVLVSYFDLTKHRDTLTHIQWNNIVLDEAHIIRVPTSPTTKAVFSLKARFRIALTGTPLQRQIEDVWSIFNFIIPGFLGEYAKFENDFILPIRKSLQYQRQKNGCG
jgi:TATA-binding protein-associated factor